MQCGLGLSVQPVPSVDYFLLRLFHSLLGPAELKVHRRGCLGLERRWFADNEVWTRLNLNDGTGAFVSFDRCIQFINWRFHGLRLFAQHDGPHVVLALLEYEPELLVLLVNEVYFAGSLTENCHLAVDLLASQHQRVAFSQHLLKSRAVILPIKILCN